MRPVYLIFFIFVFLFLAADISSAENISKRFVVDEGDIVRILPAAFDADNDNITFTFSYPINNSGEWQTDYNSSGEYIINVTAFDGENYDEAKILLKVRDINRKPEINIDEVIEAYEGESVELNAGILDPDEDNLTVTYLPPFDDHGIWKTRLGDEGEYATTITVSDTKANVSKDILIRILHTDRPPILLNRYPNNDSLDISEGDNITFKVDADDPEGKNISYRWYIDNLLLGKGDEVMERFNYLSAGKHKVRAVISDPKNNSLEAIWDIDVKDVNRLPDLSSLKDIVVNESDTITLDLASKDADNESITYNIDYPPLEKWRWKTTFDDAGVYYVNITAADGKGNVSKSIKVTVNDVDRAPEMDIIGNSEVFEGDTLSLGLKGEDPDGDDIRYRLVDGPEGADISSGNIIWNPDFDTIRHSNSWFGRILRDIGAGSILPDHKKDILFSVDACGKEKCLNKRFYVNVIDVNRKPIIEEVRDISIKESDSALAEIKAYDPDGDPIKVLFEPPFDSSGRWKTTFDDAGNYTIRFTVSDGDKNTSGAFNITVNNVDRAPVIDTIPSRDINEGEPVDITLQVKDSDKDKLNVTLDDSPSGADIDGRRVVWVPKKDFVQPSKKGILYRIYSKSRLINRYLNGNTRDARFDFQVDDGEIKAETSFVVTVHDVNDKPVIEDVTPSEDMVVRSGREVLFKVDASDKDKDNLTYSWNFGAFERTIHSKEVRRTYTTEGYKRVKLTVSDGIDEVNREWTIKVVRSSNAPPYKKSAFKSFVIEG